MKILKNGILHMNNPVFKTVFFMSFLLFLFSSCSKEKEINVKKGIADLRNIDFKNGETVKLNGQWEFYYGKLLTPGDFKDTTVSLKKEFIYVPGSWEKEKYPVYGRATYRLKVLSEDTVSQIIFMCKRIFSAYKVWLNGRLIYKAGQTGNKDEYKPSLRVLTPNPEYLKKENELIVQVSNYSDLRAGILREVRAGEVHYLLEKETASLIVLISALSIILIISIYHFILYLFLRQDCSNLIFSVLGIIVLLTGVTSNDTILKNITKLNFNTITRIFHISASLYPALIMSFFYLFYKKEIGKKFLYITVFTAILLTLISLFADVSFIRTYVGVKVVFIFTVISLLTFYVLPKALIRKRQGARWALAGMTVLFVVNVNDILFSLDVVKTGYLVIYGFLIYIIFQSFNIAERFSDSYRRNLKLAKELKKQNSELKKAKIKAENADKLKSMFLANMSHEIRTPMNAILGFSNMLAEEKTKHEKRKKIISYIIKSGNTLLQLINDIIDISKIEAGQLEINKTECCPQSLFDELELVYSEKTDSYKSEDVELIFENKAGCDYKMHTDPVRLRQILVNLTDNALKFTEKGFVKVSCNLSEDKKNIVFSVKDTGIGMTEEQCKIIFDRFVKIENEEDKIYRGAGLGLSISKNIAELLGGKLKVKSKPGKGTEFFFSVPVK